MDAGILEDILFHIHNWFERDVIDAKGCQIADGALPASITADMMEGQWYRIEGSYLNDGLHLHTATDLNDETFDGTVTLLAIPKPLLRVAEEIGDWCEAYGQKAIGPYQSESFGGYTYSLKSDTSQGGLAGWQLAFRDRLNPWRKIG